MTRSPDIFQEGLSDQPVDLGLAGGDVLAGMKNGCQEHHLPAAAALKISPACRELLCPCKPKILFHSASGATLVLTAEILSISKQDLIRACFCRGLS